MGVSPILVLFAALYHWYPKISGRMYNETMAKVHFGLPSLALTHLSSDALPRIFGSAQTIYALGNTDFIPLSAQDLNSSSRSLR